MKEILNTASGFFQKNREDWIYLSLIILVIGLLYGPFMGFPFLALWDDSNFVITNMHLDFTWGNLVKYFSAPFQDLYTPMTMVSLMVDNFLFGKEPMGYHIHNLLLHILCAGTVYFIFKRLGIRSFLAFAGCMLWALNPQKVESVIWVTERKDVLSGAFAFLSFYLFMRNVEKKSVPAASSILAVLALLTKPSTVPLPGVMMVFLLCTQWKKYTWKEYMRLLLLPLLSCGVILVISYIITAKNFPGGLERNYLIPFHNIFWYPLTALCPQVHPIYPPLLQKWYFYWKVFVFGGLAGAVFAFWGWKIKLNWQTLAGWFLITGGLMVPVLGMLNYTNFDYCDRYNYLVSAAVCGFLVFLCENSLQYIPPRFYDFMRLALMLFCGLFFLLSYFYLPDWESTEKLFARALDDKVPSNVKLYSVGAHSAITAGNIPMLSAIASRAFRDYKYYSPLQGKALHTYAFYFALHCHVLENNYKEALPYFLKLEEVHKEKRSDFELRFEKNYLPYFYRNMAMTAAYFNMNEKTLLYLEKYLKFNEERNLRGIGYYTALALKAQVIDDKNLLVEALENIVKIDPDMEKYKLELEKLKKELGKK